MMKTAALAIGLIVLPACALLDKAAICCDGGYEYRHPDEWEIQHAAAEKAARLAAWENGLQRLDEAMAHQQSGNVLGRVTELGRLLADQYWELDFLRSRMDDAAVLANKLSATQSDVRRLEAQSADLARQVGAAHNQIAELDRQLAAMEGAVRDRNRLAAELAVAHQRIAELKVQLAAAGVARAER